MVITMIVQTLTMVADGDGLDNSDSLNHCVVDSEYWLGDVLWVEIQLE